MFAGSILRLNRSSDPFKFKFANNTYSKSSLKGYSKANHHFTTLYWISIHKRVMYWDINEYVSTMKIIHPSLLPLLKFWGNIQPRPNFSSTCGNGNNSGLSSYYTNYIFDRQKSVYISFCLGCSFKNSDVCSLELSKTVTKIRIKVLQMLIQRFNLLAICFLTLLQ